ncbi:hypothetical protein QBC43DRAFT_310761 [Cladorrhinum sp. PSN259]|nr:hypothetical protein QBC43DRAFT_310761 [Cladorrhinum sp. PSN259]
MPCILKYLILLLGLFLFFSHVWSYRAPNLAAESNDNAVIDRSLGLLIVSGNVSFSFWSFYPRRNDRDLSKRVAGDVIQPSVQISRGRIDIPVSVHSRIREIHNKRLKRHHLPVPFASVLFFLLPPQSSAYTGSGSCTRLMS